jgi:hypothetical protein
MKLPTNDHMGLEHAIWTAVGVCAAYKKQSLTEGEMAGLVSRIRELRPTTMDEATAYTLAVNANHEWAALLDFPPWK